VTKQCNHNVATEHLSITLQALPATYRFATCWAHKSCWVELLDTLLELKRNFTTIVQSAMIMAPYYLAPLLWRCSSITCKMLSLCPNYEGASHKMEEPWNETTIWCQAMQ